MVASFVVPLRGKAADAYRACLRHARRFKINDPAVDRAAKRIKELPAPGTVSPR